MRTPNFLYRKTLLNCLPGQLPDDPFHLQIKQPSRSFRRVQARAFHEVINMHWFLGAGGRTYVLSNRLVEWFTRDDSRLAASTPGKPHFSERAARRLRVGCHPA